jgi:transposase
MLNRSDRDPPSLNPCPSFELCQEIRRGPAKSIRARRLRPAKQAGYKPAALSVSYHTESPCTSGGVHITRMAKSVLDCGWGQLKTQLQYKGEYAGRSVRIVNERNTSRTCSSCGSLRGPSGVNGLRVRSWICSGCGVAHDRDVNAARNILAAERLPPSVHGNETSQRHAPPSRARRPRKARMKRGAEGS